MGKKSLNFWVRKSHRYLGVVLGIQFVLWTVSGVFFTWTNIREIRGEHLRKEVHSIEIARDMISPSAVSESLAASEKGAGLTSLRVVNVLGKPYYETVYHDPKKKMHTALFDAVTGQKREEISKDEAGRIATAALNEPKPVKDVLYLTEKNVGGHHEYRGQPLPAWAVTFDHPENLTVYLTAASGQVRSFRTGNWRIFDFLWMLHTMDFIGRDDINNWALRIFSGLGMLMLVSGFLYFFITFRKPWGN